MSWTAPVLWLASTTCVLFIFYLRGPENEYSQDKLIGFATGLLITILAFKVIVASPEVELWRVGLLTVLGGVVYYSCVIALYPGLRPDTVLAFGGLRATGAELSVLGAPLTAASTVTVGLALLVGGLIDLEQSTPLTVLSFSATVLSALVMLSAGERLFIVAAPVALLSIGLCRPRSKAIVRLAASTAILALALAVVVGVMSENPLVTSTMRPGATVGERMNRSINWEAAVRRISEEPLLGYGLGGYFIEGELGGKTGLFPHNIVLEFLCETGVIGTAIIIVPLFLSKPLRSIRHLLKLRTRNGGTVIPILVLSLLFAMINDDLRQSCKLLGIFAVLWADLVAVTFGRTAPR